MSDSKIVKIGLGEALSRFIKLNFLKARGVIKDTDPGWKEIDLLKEAIDSIKLDLSFDCDGDGIPDTVEIFERSSKDDCCRVIKGDSAKKPSARRRNTKKSK
jgi:hypothetical protein